MKSESVLVIGKRSVSSQETLVVYENRQNGTSLEDLEPTQDSMICNGL
jgi:hypothetical protein